MGSIKSRFTAICLLFIVLSTTVIGGIAVWSTWTIQEESSNQIMSLTCLQQAGKLNEEFINVETSVDACAEIMLKNVKSFDDLANDQILEAYLDDVERQVSIIATNTPGVCTYYMRIDPALTSEPVGFFYTKTGRDTNLTKQPLTDLSLYEPDDVEHVGWYYQPIEAGEPLWMEPYYNQNINVYMISYIVPVFRQGRLLGIVGMDVDFNLIINVMRHIKPYQTGQAFLTSREGKVFYHPSLNRGDTITDYAPGLVDTLPKIAAIKEGETGDIVRYSSEGTHKKLVYCGLLNNMVLMLTAEIAEINAPMYSLLRTAILVTLALALMMVLVVLRLTDHITKPLIQLTKAADQIAQGNMDVKLPAPTNDEVGILTKSFAVTASSLKEYISSMHNRAYTDSLTGVKNKAAYEAALQRLSQQMNEGYSDFGLLMLDVNDLKQINDQYGHDHGDSYLRNCCLLVCHVFDHSPVYRIGGDEFVVILEHDDYNRRDDLLDELDGRIEQCATREHPWQRVSLAKGLALCEEGDATPEEVFHRADQAMYEEKRRMKRGR